MEESKNLKNVHSTPFLWNGTYLGRISDQNILRSNVEGNFEFWHIEIDGYQTICMIRKTKNYTPCLVDELKPIFGLSKLGTHYVNYGNCYIILIQARTDMSGFLVYPDVTLNHLKDSFMVPGSSDNSGAEDVIKKIKEIYVFRDLLCLSKSTDSSICIRKNSEGELYPVSLIDTSIKLDRMCNIYVSTYIPDVAFNRWIKDESSIKILRNMCKLYGDNKICTRIFKLRKIVHEAVKRVSGNEFVGFTDTLMARILNKFQSTKKTSTKSESTVPSVPTKLVGDTV
jgi:hypothetical protein